jgi:hypothetical protein
MSTCQRRNAEATPNHDQVAVPGEARRKELAAEATRLIDAGSSIIKRALEAGRKVDFLEQNVQAGGE